jgi:predicted nuclease with TOPRIM domain
VGARSERDELKEKLDTLSSCNEQLTHGLTLLSLEREMLAADNQRLREELHLLQGAQPQVREQRDTLRS